MVWIYGGGFSTGNCTRDKYGPDYFMQKQMILVTFNYRLSSLGDLFARLEILTSLNIFIVLI